MRVWLLLLTAGLYLLPARAEAKITEARLWQERFYWDGLLSARDRAARQSADPKLLDVIYAIAQQVAQQAANIQQIDFYMKSQADSLRFAMEQKDPAPSLAVIQNNFTTLAKGSDQIRNNLYYLTTRTRMASTQALPDAKLTEKAALLIAQVQNTQLKLNELYTDTNAVANAVRAETWGIDKYFRYNAEHVLNTVVSVQDSVFSVYNASYELYQLSK
jgi:hypothetical protein